MMIKRGSAVSVYADSHIGCVRRENQDTYALCTVCGGTLAVICDGMGGAAGGSIAAGAAADAFCRRFSSAYVNIIGDKDVTAIDMHRVCSDAVYTANQEVFARAVTTPGLRGMGTTLAMAFLKSNRLYVANIGDSRVYLWRAGSLSRISHDDSLVQQMIDSGRLTEDEARTSDQRHLLTRALGTAPYVECGFYTAEVAAGDVVLLCSDGLTTHYSDAELAVCLREEQDITKLVKLLLAGACARGGQDNITVACLRAE